MHFEYFAVLKIEMRTVCVKVCCTYVLQQTGDTEHYIHTAVFTLGKQTNHDAPADLLCEKWEFIQNN